MTSHSEYAIRAREMDWSALRRLWLAVKAGHTPGWPPGKAFEYLVLRAFELDGAEVVWPYLVDMGGEPIEEIDGAVYTGRYSCLVESKDTGAPANVTALAKLKTQLTRRPADVIGLFFSRSGFTEGAYALAGFFAPQTVLLWTGSDVDYVMESEAIFASLQMKYRLSVEHGMSYLRLPAVTG